MKTAYERTPDQKEFVHERLVETFAHQLSNYDTERRVEILVDRFLPKSRLTGKTALDVGCGLGFFSKRMHDHGAKVTASDLGPKLVEKTRERVGCTAVVADALRLRDQFGANAFDIVLSSECIEHTPTPNEAVKQMISVLKPGGYLSLSTPNFLWYPVVALATKLRLRPFDGFENFSSWSGLREVIESEGCEVVEEYGLHLFPFQFKMHAFSTWCDQNLQAMRWGMINICVLAQKKK